MYFFQCSPVDFGRELTAPTANIENDIAGTKTVLVDYRIQQGCGSVFPNKVVLLLISFHIPLLL